MMLVSHKHEFIYTKTFKTAGTSVESYFEKYCMPEGEWRLSHAIEEYVSQCGIIGQRGSNTRGKKWYNHMSADEIRNKIGRSTWDDYFKFCVIRNPFDKLVSAFHFFEERRNEIGHGKRRDMRVVMRRLLRLGDPTGPFRGANDILRFGDWIGRGRLPYDGDRYLIEGQVCVDFFILYEDLENGIKTVCDYLDIPFEPERIPHLKSGIRIKHLPLSAYYDSETIEIVRKRYQFEIERFGYDLPV